MNQIATIKSQICRKIALLCSITFIWAAGSLTAQDFMMQGWYWDYPKPGCNQYEGPSLASEMSALAEEQSEAGFTMMWLPPLSKASFGNCSNGYDPQDLYDYGQATGRTGLGTGTEVETWMTSLSDNDIYPIADVVYNHRDGGEWEDNPAVRDYIINYPDNLSCGGMPATPYPVNGKARYVLPLGGNSGNNEGDYFFKFASASGDPGFNGREYKLFFRTRDTGFIDDPIFESENNGGADCDQDNDQIFLGRDIFAAQEVGGSCNTDEFYLELNAGDFDADGDMLEIYIEEVGGGGTGIDQRIYGIWSASRNEDIHDDLIIQTRTDFTNMPSGEGAMTFRHFKPNGITPTCLTGDKDFPFFFFDIEQEYDGSEGGESTRKVFDDWNQWLWNTLGIRGFRLDAVKHFPAWFVGVLLNDLHAAGKNPPMVVGEHFTLDASVLRDWIDRVYDAMTPGAAEAIQVRAFDFELRDRLKQAADNPSFDTRNIFNSGLVDRVGMSGTHSVTFLNNHDYRTPGEHIIRNQMLAYAYILTNNRIGLPSIFHPDYYGIDIYGEDHPIEKQQESIDELMQIHMDFISGAEFVDYLNRFDTPYDNTYQQSGPWNHLLYQIQGGVGEKDVIVLINFGDEQLRFNHTINTANAPVGTQFTLVAGKSNFPNPEVENNPLSNSMYFDIPANSYAVYVQSDAMELTGEEGFRMLSVPVPVTYSSFLDPIWTQGADQGANVSGGDPNVFTWNNTSENGSSENWSGLNDLTDEIEAGTGFLVYVYEDDLFGVEGSFPKTLRVSGPAHGDTSPEVNQNEGGFTLLGNPFAATINFNDLVKSDLTDVAYVWDPNAGFWRSWDADGNTGDLTNGLIAPFQGFFVQSGSGNPSVTFNDQTKSSGGEFYGKEHDEQRSIVRLELSGEELQNSAWLRFSDSGSHDSQVRGDALQLEPMSHSFAKLAIEKGGTLFDISHLPVMDEEYSVPVHISATMSGSYTLTTTDFELPEYLELTFHDHAAGTSVPLNADFSHTIELAQAAKAAELSALERVKQGPIVAKATADSPKYSITVKSSADIGEPNELPERVALHQNYPNPFNPVTVITYDLPENSNVNLEVFDITGRKVATLVNEKVSAGSHDIAFDASHLSSGVYIYRLQAGEHMLTRKLTLIK